MNQLAVLGFGCRPILAMLALGCATLIPAFSSATALAAGRTEFFVAPNGKDTWTGRRSSPNWRKSDGPFATVSRALAAAREARKGQPGTAATVWLREGVYFQPETLVLTPADSDLTIAAWRSERPVISAGRPIGGWTEVKRNGTVLWVADLPDVAAGKWNFHQLWTHGKRATRARFPDNGYLSIGEIPDKTKEWTDGQMRLRFAANELQPFGLECQPEAMVMTRWVESRLPIMRVDFQSNMLDFSKRSVFQLSAKEPYYLEGALEWVNRPGEWALDSAAGKLYYFPRPGEKPDSLEAIAPALTYVLRFEGKPEAGEYVERVTLRGLAFSHAEWFFPGGFASAKDKPTIWPPPKPEVGGFAQAAIGVPGSVRGDGVRGCLFEKCVFGQTGPYGLELARGCSSNRIAECRFYDLGAGGLKLGETSVRDNPPEQSRDNEVSDCRFEDGGKMFHSAIGIWIGQSPGNRILHNLISDFYYTGISIGWTWGYGKALATNNLVAFNHVRYIGRKSSGDGPILSDMGGIYTLSMQPGTRILNNLWHDIHGWSYGGWGIYFDEGSSGILAESNLVYRTTHGGFHQHYGATNTVRNNIFAFARDHQVQRSRSEAHVSFSFKTNIVVFDSGVLLGSNWDNDKFELDYNLYFDARPDAAPESMKFPGGSLESWRKRGHDVHSLIADPRFENLSKDEYRLRADSPAFELGFRPLDLRSVGPRE